MKQQVFGAPSHTLNHLFSKPGFNLSWYWPTQLALTNDHTREPLASYMGLNSAPGDFDFWQFWHNESQAERSAKPCLLRLISTHAPTRIRSAAVLRVDRLRHR